MSGISYKLVDQGKRGMLTESAMFDTGITGHHGETDYCTLTVDGRLFIRAGFVWDFGSGAIDTPAMVIASLAHDALCILTNERKVPWSVRAQADRFFREQLKANSPPGVLSFASRWWRWSAVRVYSAGIARWRDRL